MLLLKVLRGWGILVWEAVVRILLFPCALVGVLVAIGLKASGAEGHKGINKFLDWYDPLIR